MRSITAALAAATLVLTACTGSSADVENDPEEALRDAVEALGDYDGIELVLSASGDAAALADDPEDVEAVELLLNSTITVRGSGQDEQDAQFELIVDLDGNDVFELRGLPEMRLFVRADLDALADAIDDPTVTDDLQGLVDAAAQFGLQDVAQAAADGEWIELTGVDQLTEFAEGFAGPGQTADEPSEEELEQLQEQIVAAFDRFIDDDVTVTYVGSEDAGERVQATSDGAAIQSLFEELTAIAAQAGGVDPGLLGDVDSDVPAGETFTLDVWLDGGELSQIGVDLGAFDDSGEVPADTFLLIGVSDFSGTVDEPADAQPFDLFELISGFLFGGLGGMDGLGGPGMDDGTLPDGSEDGGLEDDLGGEPGDLEEQFGDDLDAFEDQDIECVPQDEVDEFGLQELVDEGFLEVC